MTPPGGWPAAGAGGGAVGAGGGAAGSRSGAGPLPGPPNRGGGRRFVGYAGATPELDELLIRAAVVRYRWGLLGIARETDPAARPVLAAVLREIHLGHADGLVVARLERLGGSLGRVVEVVDDAYRKGWILIGLDVTAGLEGLAVASEMQRRLTGYSTRQALDALREQGVRLGRPRRCPDDVLARVVEARERGARLADICAALNQDGVPTPAGGQRWYPSHLSRLLRTQDARELARREETARSAPGEHERQECGGDHAA